jgi:hypothetical protein
MMTATLWMYFYSVARTEGQQSVFSEVMHTPKIARAEKLIYQYSPDDGRKAKLGLCILRSGEY